MADRGGVPNGGREDRPDPPDHAQQHGPPDHAQQQGPPPAQQQPQPKATPPGQERRPEGAPDPPGQERRDAPRPRRPQPEPQVHRSQSPNGPPGPQGNPDRPATPQDRGNGNRGSGQDKTTVCHATGSATNPYVEITIANPALRAHGRHGDLIPAPAGGCPGGSDASRDRIDICHATGSETNPYVLLEDMPQQSLNGHGGHENDIIPAPDDGVCPAVEQPAGTLTGEIPASAFLPRSDDGTPPGTPGTPAELRSGTGTGPGEEVPASGVLGVLEERPPAQASLPATATAAGGDPAGPAGGALPFTGLQLLMLLGLGAGALAGGLALRRAAGAVQPA